MHWNIYHQGTCTICQHHSSDNSHGFLLLHEFNPALHLFLEGRGEVLLLAGRQHQHRLLQQHAELLPVLLLVQRQ